MSAKAEAIIGPSLYVEGAAGTGKTVLALQVGCGTATCRAAIAASVLLPRLAAEIREVEQGGRR